MRSGPTMVRTHVTRIVDTRVLQAHHDYQQRRKQFLDGLENLSRKYPYLMEQKKEQGLFPGTPPSRLSL